MKKIIGILLLAVTLLSGITVLAASSGTNGTSMGAGDKHKHHRRHHRRWHRHGGAMKGDMKKDNMKH